MLISKSYELKKDLEKYYSLQEDYDLIIKRIVALRDFLNEQYPENIKGYNIDNGFKNYIKRLEQSNRDQSIKGRINEFTRVITSNLFEFTEFIEIVLNSNNDINQDTLNHFSNILVDANNSFQKLIKIISNDI